MGRESTIVLDTDTVREILSGKKRKLKYLVNFLSGKNPNWTGYIKDGLMLYNGRNEPCCPKPPCKVWVIDIEFECKSAEKIMEEIFLGSDNEELMEQLRQEEICCENCNYWKEYGLAGCDGCGTYGNKLTFEAMLAEMQE